MEIVFLEYASLGEDIDLSRFDRLGHVTKYPFTPVELIAERVKDADVAVTNKLPMNETTLAKAGHLRMIAVTATGTNNVDHAYARSRGIEVTNVAGYSTDAVAQHTAALLLYLVNKLAYYDAYVKSGEYCASPTFSHFGESIFELQGKTWGIVGMGAIGQKVAQLAKAFGCRVIYCSTSGKNTDQPYTCVTFEELLAQADIVSVHAPLTPATEHMFDRAAFEKMKRSAVFINVARGPIVDEEALACALEQGEIAGAGLDVLSKEPVEPENPLLRIKDSGKLVITPHIAWIPRETRERLMDGVFQNIQKVV